MAKTVIGLNDPKAVRRYSGHLAVDTAKKSYFNKKFMGKGEEAQTPLQTLTHLENDAGDKISFDLVMQLGMEPVEGDDELEGKEEDLKFYTDEVNINQMRGGVNTGGRMTRKRTLHDLRKIARSRQSDWWARVFDELFFMYLSGARGINPEFIFKAAYPGFAGNPLVAPDDMHHMFADNSDPDGAALAKNTMTANDTMTLKAIDRMVARASTMGGGKDAIPAMEPCKIDGEDHFVMVMHPWQSYDLRTNVGTGGWLDIQKAAAGAEGRKNPIFKGGLGMHNNVVLHEHKNVIRFDKYGADSKVNAGRALFLGRQAGVVAFGSPGTNLRFDWHEETDDRGNQVVISTHSIFGMKKTAFEIKKGSTTKSRDFGVIAMDTAINDPS